MLTGLTYVTPPAFEPVDASDLVIQSRINQTDISGLLDDYCQAAREWVEARTGRQLAVAQLMLTLGGFPTRRRQGGRSADQMPGGERNRDTTYGGQYPLTLPRSPVVSVESITYVQTDGSRVTWPPSNYVVANQYEPARVVPVFGGYWPVTLPHPQAVQVTFTAGYDATKLFGTASKIPKSIRQAILLLAAHQYEHREAYTDGPAVTEIPGGVEALLSRYVTSWVA